MSAIEKLEERVAALEAEVAKLRNGKSSTERASDSHTWLDAIYGSFANDPLYLEAMRLGRAYRESTRPKKRKPKKK
jgi:hypothetical protein